MSNFNTNNSVRGRKDCFRYGHHLLLLLCLANIVLTVGMADAQSEPISSPIANPQLATGSLQGKIVNGTNGTKSSSPAGAGGQSVKLERLENSGRQAQPNVTEQTVAADQQGNFSFAGLAIGENFRYFVSTTYNGVIYYVEQELKLTVEKPTLNVELKIYETGSNEKEIEFSSASVVIPEADSVSGQVLVLEMYTVLNKSDRTFIGQPISATFANAAQRRTTLRFVLPTGATGVTPSSGVAPEDIIQTTDGMEITTPLRPGNNQLVFSYQLPYQGEKLVMPKRFVYDTASFRLFTPLDGIKARSSRLAALTQPIQMGNQKLLGLIGQDIKANETLSIELSSLPLPASKGILATRDFATKLLVILFILAVPVFLVVYIRKKRVIVVDSGAEREKLLRWIAQSDTRYDAGFFDTDEAEAEYRQKRTLWKNRLLALAAASEVASYVKTTRTEGQRTEETDGTKTIEATSATEAVR